MLLVRVHLRAFQVQALDMSRASLSSRQKTWAMSFWQDVSGECSGSGSLRAEHVSLVGISSDYDALHFSKVHSITASTRNGRNNDSN